MSGDTFNTFKRQLVGIAASGKMVENSFGCNGSQHAIACYELLYDHKGKFSHSLSVVFIAYTGQCDGSCRQCGDRLGYFEFVPHEHAEQLILQAAEKHDLSNG